MRFYETSEEILKNELLRAATESRWVESLFDIGCPQVVELHEKLAANDVVIKSVV